MPFSGQWADSLLAFERVHLIRLALWGAASILAGTSVLAWIRIRGVESPLLTHFAAQCTGWGAAILALSLWSNWHLALRDLAAAVALDRTTWFMVGLGVGIAALGVTLAVAGWRVGRRLAPVGAGIGIIVQGLAIVLLQLEFAAALVR